MKGFKILEASYKESQRNLFVTEERLLTLDALYNRLAAEMEAAKQGLHDCEAVRHQI